MVLGCSVCAGGACLLTHGAVRVAELVASPIAAAVAGGVVKDHPDPRFAVCLVVAHPRHLPPQYVYRTKTLGKTEEKNKTRIRRTGHTWSHGQAPAASMHALLRPCIPSTLSSRRQSTKSSHRPRLARKKGPGRCYASFFCFFFAAPYDVIPIANTVIKQNGLDRQRA